MTKWAIIKDIYGRRKRYNLDKAEPLNISIPEDECPLPGALENVYLFPKTRVLVFETCEYVECASDSYGIKPRTRYHFATEEEIIDLYEYTGDERLLPFIMEGEV